MNKSLSIVVSVYNEEDSLESFYEVASRYIKNLDMDYELIFVNDGSVDKSEEIIREFAKKDDRVKALLFSRNFGHEAAMIAGIDYAGGDYIVCMDADLQHPPGILKDIIFKFNEGYDIINMIRTSNTDAGLIKNITSSIFYSGINLLSKNKLEKNASDFFAISKKVANVLRKDYREKVRFLRGYVQNIGFKKTSLPYIAQKRVAGHSKYSLHKLLKFSMDTILCFSDMPLKLGLYAGTFSIFLGLLMAIYTIVTWARVGTPNGYATIIVLLCFMFAMLFLIVGIIGQYIAILFTELKNRPIYIVDESLNIDK
jgi:glycosyltransferase, group 2 family